MVFSEEAVSTQTLALLPPALVFWRIRKCLDTAVSFFFSSSSEPKITYTCYPTQQFFFWLFFELFYLLFGWLTANFVPLAMIQLHSPDANHCVFIIFSSEDQRNPRNDEVFETWDGLHIDAQTQTERLAYWKTDEHKKVKT